MASKRNGGEPVGPYLGFAVAVLKPILTVTTKREREGTEFLDHVYPPNDGIVIVANHTSWFDPLNISHVLWDHGRPPHFLAKDKLFTLPGLGPIMNGSGQIPVYRNSDDKRSAIRAAIEAVNKGQTVIVYPEGTMTRDPEMWPMSGRTGAAELAFSTGAPVIPMAQWGPEQVMRPYKNELHLIPRKTMKTVVGPPIDLDDLRSDEPTVEALRQATDRIIGVITSMLEELRGQKAPEQRMSFKEWKAAQEAQAAEQSDKD